MVARFSLLALFYGGSLLVARAQGQAGPAYFLRHPAGQPPPARFRPAPVAALPATWAAAATTQVPARPPLTAPAGSPSLPAATGELLEHRPDATGVRPLYDLYRDLPEDFRKHTLPAAYVEPLPVQLLRSALGR